MFQFLLFIGLIVLIVMVNKQSRRLDALEAKIGVTHEENKKPATTSQEPVRAEKREQVEYQNNNPQWMKHFGAWLQEDWMLKVGALLLLIAFGWFATYAFTHNWVDAMGRIIIGLVAGVLVLGFGQWRIRTYLHQGAIFLVLGSSIVLVTLFAARELYEFFTPTTALIAMFVSTVVVGVNSVVYRTRVLSLISLGGAALAPLLTNAPVQNETWLFSYLLVVVVSALGLGLYTQRRELTLGSLVVFWLYSMPYLFEQSYQFSPDNLLYFAYAFCGLFLVANVVEILRAPGDISDGNFAPALFSAAGVGVLSLIWTVTTAAEAQQSLLVLVWTVLFAFGTYLVGTRGKKKEGLFMYLGASIVLLGAATSLELEVPQLTLAFTAEALLICLGAQFLFRSPRAANVLVLLFAAPLALLPDSMQSVAWNKGWVHADALAMLVTGVVILGLGLLYHMRHKEHKETLFVNTRIVLMVLGSATLYSTLWLVLKAALENNDTATMISLVVFTVIGLWTHIQGKMRQSRALALYGGVLLGLVIARLLLVEVWNMELIGKIITFFIVGLLLVSTAFIGRKEKRA